MVDGGVCCKKTGNKPTPIPTTSYALGESKCKALGGTIQYVRGMRSESGYECKSISSSYYTPDSTIAVVDGGICCKSNRPTITSKPIMIFEQAEIKCNKLGGDIYFIGPGNCKKAASINNDSKTYYSPDSTILTTDGGVCCKGY